VFTAHPSDRSTESERAQNGERGRQRGPTPRNVEYRGIRRAHRNRFLQRNLSSGGDQRAVRSLITKAVRNEGLSSSRGDYELTARLVHAGRILGIPVLDSIVIGHERYHSMRDEGGM
jgi:RadC-like JAB domain-containing protein